MEGGEMKITIRKIVEEWLKKNGCDGLCLPSHGCGCELNDLMPCDEPSPRCVAGVAVDPPDDIKDDVVFWIVPEEKK
jgi:hypothetical protein